MHEVRGRLMVVPVVMAVVWGGLPAPRVSADVPREREPVVLEESPPLVLHITPEKTTLIPGEKYTLRVSITNRGTESVTLVMPGDGSDAGWRTPVIGRSELSGDRGKHPDAPERDKGRRCGNINALKADEVFTLRPGETKEVRKESFAAPVKTGTFRVVYYYTNDPALKWRGIPLGKHDEEAMAKVRKSFRCALRSNEVRLRVAG
jgi:hypothetical protein